MSVQQQANLLSKTAIYKPPRASLSLSLSLSLSRLHVYLYTLDVYFMSFQGGISATQPSKTQWVCHTNITPWPWYWEACGGLDLRPVCVCPHRHPPGCVVLLWGSPQDHWWHQGLLPLRLWFPLLLVKSLKCYKRTNRGWLHNSTRLCCA